MQISFRHSSISKIIVHKIGIRTLEEGVLHSNNLISLAPDEEAKMLNYFLKPFKDQPEFCLTHPVDHTMNELFIVVNNFFNGRTDFVKASKELATLLYEASEHPRIKPGDFYFVSFENCLYNEHLVQLIGIFKSEEKESFVAVDYASSETKLNIEDGFSLSRLDKGCLILNKNEESGYIVYNIDHSSRTQEALYWVKDFLSLAPVSDDYYFTNNMLALTKKFVTTGMSSLPDISAPDKIDYLNRSVDYFKKNEQFNINEFEETVFQHDNIIKEYRKFGGNYLEENKLEISGSFGISANAVKKQARVFKKILKLDRNFHIYIHGDKNLIEQGTESDGRKYYKIYYQQES